MNEITYVTLENEMDLILAHKQAMRLAELTGLGLPAQTTFATAVSEVSRGVVGEDNGAKLRLFVSAKADKIKFITAVLEDNRQDFTATKDEGYIYAKRLVSNIQSVTEEGINKTALSYRLPPTVRIDDIVVEKLRINLNTDPAVSPYEEIKRKNRQLVELADKLRESEQQYKSLTDSLPIMIFSMTLEGKITYANKWLHDYTGTTIDELMNNGWQNIALPADLERIWAKWAHDAGDATITITPELRIRDINTGEYRWHTGASIAITEEDGTVKCRNTYLVDVHAQKMVEQAFRDNLQLKEAQAQLEEKVRQLNLSNEQLEQFAYVASHDLQEPLRKISFYSDTLKRKYGVALGEEAGTFFDNLINATARMRGLIQDVLAYSTVRNEGFTTVDLNQIATETILDLEITIKEKQAEVHIGQLPAIQGNARQLKQLFENLLSNALKFSKPGVAPVINVTCTIQGGNILLAFADHGIGFEEKYVSKMFNLFQRLHQRDQYSGTGIGLAICKKIAELHNGYITAESIPGISATFTVAIPVAETV